MEANPSPTVLSHLLLLVARFRAPSPVKMKGKDKSELAEITRQFLLLSFPRMIGDRINVLRELS